MKLRAQLTKEHLKITKERQYVNDMSNLNLNTLGRTAGWSLLAMIGIGIFASIFIAKGIDINLSADVSTTATNMLEAESQLRGKAYISLLTFSLETLFAVCLFLLLRRFGPVLATWGLFINMAGAFLALLGAVFAMNAAELASNIAYSDAANNVQQIMLTRLQATSDYTSFHLGLVISSFGNAVFFYLFYRSGFIPRIIAGWGIFASLFVSFAIVARDFIPALASNGVTVAFMLSNLIALISTALYLVIRGVRS